MKLKSFSYLVGLIIVFLNSPLLSEDKIDIWKNKKENSVTSNDKETKKIDNNELNLNSSQTIEATEKIEIQEGGAIQQNDQKIYGIYEPANFDLNLNMWSSTKAEDLRSSLKRIDKIKLSKSSNEILDVILFSFSYPPQGMTEKEFVNLKMI